MCRPYLVPVIDNVGSEKIILFTRLHANHPINPSFWTGKLRRESKLVCHPIHTKRASRLYNVNSADMM